MASLIQEKHAIMKHLAASPYNAQAIETTSHAGGMSIVRLQRSNHGSGFRAYTVRGDKNGDPISPFLGVDHAWMRAATFPPHPHAGFSAVSYLFLDSETGIVNRDSLGTHNLIQPGGLHWTAAGRGVVHEEIPAESGKTVHMLQMFVNLTAEKQAAPAFALSLVPQEVPTILMPGVKIRIPLGCFRGQSSPLTPPTEVGLIDISLEEDAELSVPIVAGQSAFVMVIHGALLVNGALFESDSSLSPVFMAQTAAHEVTLRATQGNAKAVVFSGVPLQQEVHWKGSLALASATALSRSISDYQRGEFGELVNNRVDFISSPTGNFAQSSPQGERS